MNFRTLETLIRCKIDSDGEVVLTNLYFHDGVNTVLERRGWLLSCVLLTLRIFLILSLMGYLNGSKLIERKEVEYSCQRSLFKLGEGNNWSSSK